jgi:homoserine dehydrogenase
MTIINDQKVRFAVVGAGHIGKRHAEMIRRDEEGELVAMVDVRSMCPFSKPLMSCLHPESNSMW